MNSPLRVGVLGCGNISPAYLTAAKTFPSIQVTACADIDLSRAQSRAAEFGIPLACLPDDLIKSESVDLVVNLTVPAVHAKVTIQALESGKHVYSEKPLGISLAEGHLIAETAKKAGRRVGCAPDTFFGAGIQTVRHMIDEGRIGKPVAFTGFMVGMGPESWHPNPEFFYKRGAGPMFDMGPYYLTALLQLLGPAQRVAGISAIAIPERTIGTGERKGQKVRVEIPDHVTGSIAFQGGAVGTLTTSFATLGGQWIEGFHLPHLLIHGTEGAIQVPDPNGFDGEVKWTRQGMKSYETVPFSHAVGYGRSVGVADMAEAIAKNRPHRASLEQALSVLEMMEAFEITSVSGKAVELSVPYQRTDALPAGKGFGVLS